MIFWLHCQTCSQMYIKKRDSWAINVAVSQIQTLVVSCTLNLTNLLRLVESQCNEQLPTRSLFFSFIWSTYENSNLDWDKMFCIIVFWHKQRNSCIFETCCYHVFLLLWQYLLKNHFSHSSPLKKRFQCALTLSTSIRFLSFW